MTVTIPPPGEVLRHLGGKIDVRVELDTGMDGAAFGIWDTSLWDVAEWGQSDPYWADMTNYVFSVSIAGGAQRWGERFNSASARIVVDNTWGFFTPESGVPHWHLPFQPGRRIRVVAIPHDDDVKYPLFTGQIDATRDLYDDAAHAITTSIECTDYMTVWSAYNPVMLVTPTGTQRTDLRVHAALNRLGWPMDQRDIQVGAHSLASSFLAQSTLEECQTASDGEGSGFWCSREGHAVFKNRDWLTTDDRSVNIQGWLGYQELPYPADAIRWDEGLWDVDIWQGFEGNAAHIIAVEASWEQARIFNHTKMARTGGVMQVVEDLTSQGAFGLRTHQRTDFELATDVEVAILATRFINAFKDSRMRVDSVTVTAVDDPLGHDLNRILWDTQFGDRLAIRIITGDGWIVDKEVHVLAGTHTITADDWIVQFQLDDAQTWEET